MKKITQKEFDKLEFLEQARKVSMWNQCIQDLKAGEGIVITKEEWSLKGPPKVMAHYVAKRLGRTIISRILKDGTGWAVFRKK